MGLIYIIFDAQTTTLCHLEITIFNLGFRRFNVFRRRTAAVVTIGRALVTDR